jgi:hypothetical protein
MLTTMWEVRAAHGRLGELQDWVIEHVEQTAQVYRAQAAGADSRLVVIDPTGRAALDLAAVPEALVARAPHAWDFEPVRVPGPGG